MNPPCAESPAPAPPAAHAAAPAPGHPFDAALEADRDALRELFPLPPARAPRRGAHNPGAAAFVLVAAAAALFWADPAWRTEHHATAIGERRELRLADGSVLTLDTATTLDVAWHLRSRRVALARGQARLAVAPCAWRPFEVLAADVRIRDVGTVFDVRREGGRVQVTVIEGQVDVERLHAAGALQRLAPGQRLRLGGDGGAAPEAVDPAQAGAWRQGRLLFDRTPLREVLAEVQRYRSAPIRLRDDGRLGSQAVSGVFETANTDQLLDLLPRIVPARMRRHADGSVDIGPSG